MPSVSRQRIAAPAGVSTAFTLGAIGRIDLVAQAGDSSTTAISDTLVGTRRRFHGAVGHTDEPALPRGRPERSAFDAEGVRLARVHGHRHPVDRLRSSVGGPAGTS